jgi:DNA end-binding protein Ku
MAQRGSFRRLGLLVVLGLLGVLAVALARRSSGDDHTAPGEGEDVVWHRPPAAQSAPPPTANDPIATSVHDLLALTRQELYERAQAREIPGRSRMSKRELAEAIAATRL